MNRWLVIAFTIVSLIGCSGHSVPGEDPPGSPTLPPNADVTFYVTADMHFGAEGVDLANAKMIEQLNTMPGRPYPANIGGTVDKPRAVLALGDLTDSGMPNQWLQFESAYGLNGTEAKLKFPVLETFGNHDWSGIVEWNVKRRHGSLPYSWNWGGVHFVMFGKYPDAHALDWLKNDLQNLPADNPLVLCQHFNMTGAFSDLWKQEEKDAYAKALEGRNVLAIFHGHWHLLRHYRWENHDAYQPGSPRHDCHTFLVVHIVKSKMTVAAWDWENEKWLAIPEDHGDPR